MTLYAAVDEPVARPILAEFEHRTGIHVNLIPDSEATKTAGLAECLLAERDRPRCDVWWSNEPFHTINLAEAGVLAEYDSPSAADVLPEYKDGLKHRWAGGALRARVIARWTGPGSENLPAIESLADLAAPALKGRIAMSRPGIGTVGGHVAALYVLWGDDRADAFLRSLKENGLTLVGGNSVVADTVARGQLYAGLTDNDDVDNASREGGKLRMIVPSEGTLLVPTTVGVVVGAAHADAARKLVDYLLSAEVERKLIDAKFALQSVREKGAIKRLPIDYVDAARAMPRANERAARILEGR